MAIHNFTAKVISKEQLTPIVYFVRYEIPSELQFTFAPGQFVSIVVAKNIRRSYSIANMAGENNYLDLLVDIEPGGPGSQYFVNLAEGESSQMLGALGTFQYYSNDREVHFYAAGTGIAPFVPMISQELEEIKSGRQIKLFMGFRYQHDIFWQEQLQKWQSGHANFVFQTFISRHDENWLGETGYVNKYITALHHNNIDAYICGGTRMIKDTEQKLLSAGVAAENIYYEKYF